MRSVLSLFHSPVLSLRPLLFWWNPFFSLRSFLGSLLRVTMWHGGLCQTLIFGVNFGRHFCYLVLGLSGGHRGSYSKGNSQLGMLPHSWEWHGGLCHTLRNEPWSDLFVLCSWAHQEATTEGAVWYFARTNSQPGLYALGFFFFQLWFVGFWVKSALQVSEDMGRWCQKGGEWLCK